ncbi:helix-turn-helix domain-containing protein [Haladaptatus caseinilyticus]|uniref:helix-turn-helix domain-containing protein n=1 Tax=Haladaptatus caseinilyticus TaxID=2993314 RepID=UPI00224B5C41|nr:helix-turn-helix domain-containing protein [Haladaptatus caseinilyticus]
MGGTIVEVSIAAEEFALKHTLATLETVTIEVEQTITTDRDGLMPFIWFNTDDSLALECALTDDDSVTDFHLIADFETESLYQLTWNDRVNHLVRVLAEENGAVLAATGKDDTWHLRLLFADHDAVRRTSEYCKEEGVPLEIQNIQEFTRKSQTRFGLTKSQQRALQLATTHGYYSVPREATADDLAEKLDVSHQALSERLRRAHGNLVDYVFLNRVGTPEVAETDSDKDVASE